MPLNPLTQATGDLVRALREIGQEHGEIGDTDVREQLHAVIAGALFDRIPGYRLPVGVGMFSGEAEGRVMAQLRAYVESPGVRQVIADQALTRMERVALFQGSAVDVAEFFGWEEGADSADPVKHNRAWWRVVVRWFSPRSVR